MANAMSLHKSGFLLWLIVLTMIVGCAGRRITTAVEDQTFQPGPSSATSFEAETVAPLSKVETAEPESRPAVPSTEEVRTAEGAPSKAEAGVPEAGPAVSPAEERVAEEPLAVVPPPQPDLPPIQQVAELSDIYFDFDQYAIRDDAQSVLEMNAGFLKSQPGHSIVIEGHCDERGTSAYNLVLGERRAQAAKQYLQELGVGLSQIQITSYGKERPFCGEHSEDCWQSNRRAHFRRP